MHPNATADTVCYPPFLAESAYSAHGGYLNGRLCASITGGAGGGQCCLPCPLTDWIYPDSFDHSTRVPGFIAFVSLLLCAFMLLSFAVLPAEKTRRQYLNVCLVISVFIFELGLTVPVLGRPNQCYNAITPNSDTSSLTCAFSGAFVIFGGAATNMWTFVRALSMHLMVCWDITPKSHYYYSVQALAWSVSALLLGISLGITGVSFRTGDYCLVNHEKAFGTFWGPILGVAAITSVLQLSTFGYCLHIYLRSLRAERARNSGPNTSSTGLQRRQNALAVYQRVKIVLSLQWRALAIVTIMVVYIVFFCIVFVILDEQSVKALNNTASILPWVACLIESSGDKTACLSLAKPLTVNPGTLIAALVLFSLLGIQAALLIGRWGMITGWIELFRAWWTWRSGSGDIGFNGTAGAREREDGAAVKELEEQRNSTVEQQPMRMGDKRTYELVRVSDASGAGSRLAAVETGKRASAFGTMSSTLSSGGYGSDDIGVAVADVDEDDDFASEYWKEYGGASFGTPVLQEHGHEKSSSSGWTRDNELRNHSADSLTALPPVRLGDRGEREGIGRSWPL